MRCTRVGTRFPILCLTLWVLRLTGPGLPPGGSFPPECPFLLLTPPPEVPAGHRDVLFAVNRRLGELQVIPAARRDLQAVVLRPPGASPCVCVLFYAPDSSRGLPSRALFWETLSLFLAECRRMVPDCWFCCLGDANMHWPALDAARPASPDLPISLACFNDAGLVCYNPPGAATHRSGTILD